MADQFQYLIAFHNTAYDDPSLFADPGSPGVAGNPGTPPTIGAAGTWTDVTQYVTAHSWTRGRQHELERFETGQATVDLANHTAAFNTWNTSSPFAGLLTLMLPIQIRRIQTGVSYNRWTGLITAYPTQWPDEVNATAQLTCADAFRLFALADITRLGYREAVLADTPDLYYRLGDTVDARALDSSGNNRTGRYVLGTQGVPGALLFDTDAAFDCSATGYVNAPAAASITGTGPFTIEFWVNLHGQPDASLNAQVYNQVDPSGSVLLVYFAPGTGSLCQLLMVASDGTNQVAVGTTTFTMPIDGKYHHIVVERTAGVACSLYIDGVSQAINTSTAGTGIPNLVLTANSNAFLTWGRFTPPGFAGQATVPGAIDEAAIYRTTAISGARVLAHYNAGAHQWGGQFTGQRINAVLDTVGWSATARALDTGATLCAAVTTDLTQTKSLTYMQQAELTEAGALFMHSSGVVRFLSRTRLLQTTASSATFGDNSALTGGSEIPFLPNPDVTFDDLDIWNEVVGSMVSGTPLAAQDAASIAQYGRRTLNLDGLLNNSTTDAISRIYYALDHYRNPLVRLRALTVRPLAQPSTVAAVLGRELMARVTVNRHYMPGGGTTFAQVCLVEKMTEKYQVQPGDWTVEFALSPSDARTYWLLGDAVYGVLGSTTRLGY